MKLIISFYLVSLIAHADFIHIHHMNNTEDALIVEKILRERWGIPHDYIKSFRAQDCNVSNMGYVMTFCINKKGELKTLSINNKRIKTLRSFKTPTRHHEKI